MSLASQRGFTLVEAITAGVISTVLAGVILTSLHLTSDSTKKGTEIIRASQKANLVSWQFRALARRAYVVAGGNEKPTDGNFNALGTRITSHFHFIGPPPGYDTLGGFKYELNDHRLWEAFQRNGGWHNNWRPFVIGDKDTVYTRLYEAEELPTNSHFTLYPGRRAISFHTAFRYNPTSYLPTQTERFLCRNPYHF